MRGISLCSLVVVMAAACGSPPEPEAAPTPQASAVEPQAPPPEAPPPATAAAAPGAAPAAAPAGPSCHATAGDSNVDLRLTWDKDTAEGELTTTAKGGKVTTTSVSAQLRKGLVLVYPKGKSAPKDQIATMQTEGARKLQVGDAKKPWVNCD